MRELISEMISTTRLYPGYFDLIFVQWEEEEIQRLSFFLPKLEIGSRVFHISHLFDSVASSDCLPVSRFTTFVPDLNATITI